MTQTKRGKTFKDLVTEAKQVIQEIDVSTLKADLEAGKSCSIIDVREPEDFANGHVPGAINIPRGMLELEIDELVPNQNQPVVLYCGGGSRSALAAQTLQIMGYDQVKSLAGGWRHWSQG
jgi:sulfur-carrier protein adenylyltransferase/sulfurtransferase